MSEHVQASEVEATVIAIIKDSLSPKVEITPATKFKEDLKADELEVYEVIYRIENEMGTTIPESEANDVETVADLIKPIQSRPAR
ncbi:phosphopantetheine-binding protein [Streptomyces sp. NPDC002232]|uniref:phosphopantetheine-binding protein n=1 Tax=Streptomyces sp. NPDC002232 TaxID=3364640 RepID=UPI003675A524